MNCDIQKAGHLTYCNYAHYCMSIIAKIKPGKEVQLQIKDINICCCGFAVHYISKEGNIGQLKNVV